MTMLAFHGDPAIKAKYQARVEAHRLADEIVQGKGWDGHRGCQVGCTLDRYDHRGFERELGIPKLIAHLTDSIHEGLPDPDYKSWPGRFLSAVPVGADLGQISLRFRRALLTDTRLALRDKAFDDGKSVIDAVVSLLDRSLAGLAVTDNEWDYARVAAQSAIGVAIESDDNSAGFAWQAVECAQEATRSGISYIPSVTWCAALCFEVRENAYQIISDILIELISSAPVPSLTEAA